MATQVYAGQFHEVRGSLTSLTTTAQYLLLPKGAQTLVLESLNPSAAGTVTQFLLNPFAAVVKTADGGATWTDYSEAAQDLDTATDVVLSSLDTLANGDALWVGSWVPFAGLSVDVDAANSNASVLAVHYPVALVMTNITPTDNTANAGATFGQDGTITWAVPTDWSPQPLRALLSGANNTIANGTRPLYWVRLTVSAALDSSTTQNSLVTINRSTQYAGIKAGLWQQEITWGHQGISCVQAKTSTGTADLQVTTGAKTRFAD